MSGFAASNVRAKRGMFSLTTRGLAALVVLAGASTASAGELTDVLDAFDYENDNPVDFNFEPSFRYENHTGTIAREAPGEDATGLFAELGYQRSVTAIDLDMRLGLYRDLEFNLTLPVVLGDQRRLSFTDTDTGPVRRDNSTVYPTDANIAADLDPGLTDPYGSEAFGTYHYFDVPYDGPRRQGVGDMRFGFAWSPFSQQQREEYATMTFGLDYVAPTGKVAYAHNTGVGRGVHELQFWLGGSRQVWFFEPYYGMRFGLPMPSQNSLFQVPVGSTQQYRGPGMHGLVTTGTEIIMWEDVETNQRYTFDAGLDFGYQHAGREYSPLFDALGNSTCNQTTPAETGASLLDSTGQPDGTIYNPRPEENIEPNQAACAWVVQQPSNEVVDLTVAPANRNYIHDGITDVDSYTVFGGHAALYLQFSRYIELQILGEFMTQSDHFLTAANTGENTGDNTSTSGSNVCIDDPDYVSLNPNCGERNPYYNPTLDGVGRRFMMQGAFDFTLHSTLAFQF